MLPSLAFLCGHVELIIIMEEVHEVDDPLFRDGLWFVWVLGLHIWLDLGLLGLYIWLVWVLIGLHIWLFWVLRIHVWLVWILIRLHVLECDGSAEQ